MFADEARFGRMNRPRPCWAPAGIRPRVAAQLVREYIYLYGAVAPKDGTCVYLIMPTSNTACFQAFLDVLSRKFARQHILLVLDGAPNHRSGQLVVPDNIALLFLRRVRAGKGHRSRHFIRSASSNENQLFASTQSGSSSTGGCRPGGFRATAIRIMWSSRRSGSSLAPSE
jgi:hypothetical protein